MTKDSMTFDSRAEVAAHWAASDLSAGDLSSREWNSAEAVEITRRWSGEDAPPERHTEARILWTEQALCIRFTCRQTEPLVASSTPVLDQKTLGLWNRDVCEIFVAPDPNAPQRYFEFEAAPTGEWVDLAINFDGDLRETDFEFQSGMTTAASLSDEQLVIAIRIPWSNSLPKPQKGDRWRVNFFRCVGTWNVRYLAWLPTYAPEPNFHVPAAFGWLRFT